MLAIEELQKGTAKFLIVFLWIHVLVIVGAGLYTGVDFTVPVIAVIILNAMATVAWRLDPSAASVRHMITVAIIGMDAFLVYEFKGHPWQIDIHFYFFATLAMLTAFACWQTIVLAVAVIALHHLLLNFTFPLFLFPEGSQFTRVLFHAVVVIMEAAVILVLIRRIRQALINAEDATQAATNARKEVQEMAERREERKKAREEKLHEIRTNLINDFQNKVMNTLKTLDGGAVNLAAQSRQMISSSSDICSQTESIASRAGEAARTARSSAEFAVSLSDSVEKVRETVHRSNQLTGSAVEITRKTDEIFTVLEASTNRIGDVIQLISDVAEQTNLLALNATIEAARAGDAGKGFAVVAGEVKSLANQTRTATDEISSQISEVQQIASDATKAIQEITGIIRNISEYTGNMNNVIDEQTRTADRIISGIRASSEAVSDLSSALDSISRASVESSDSARELESISSRLGDISSRLQSDASQFLSSINQEQLTVA